MGAPTFLFTLLLIDIILFINTTTAATNSSSIQSYKAYVQTACNSSTYPQICYKALSSYATTIRSDPQKLCKYAISITLKVAINATSTFSKLANMTGLTKGEAAVVKACKENIQDSVDELKLALTSMINLGGEEIQLQLDDIRTWVGASLTDEDTCKDGFDEENVSMAVKNTINKSVLNFARLASNALSLIDNLKY